MSDEAALLAAINAHPEEDTPRLAYADWLDERGGAANADRAEYIRLEIELDRAEVVRHRVPPELQEKEKRSRTLFAKHYKEWFPAFYGRGNLLRGARASIRVRRGFPYCIYPHNPVRLVFVGEELFARAPITDLILNNLTESVLAAILRQPWISRTRYIQFAGFDIPPTEWAAVADSPNLKQLDELVLCGGILRPDDASRMAKANPCPHLKRLGLSVPLTDDAIARLFGGRAFTGLEELDLDTEKIGPAGIKALTSAAPLKRLKSLKMSYHKLPGIAKALTSATFWPRLEHLELNRVRLGNAGLAELVSGKRTKLTTLRLDDNGITSAGMRALAASPMLASVTTLDLSDNKFGNAGVIALVNSPYGKNLQSLDLFGCKFGVEGARAIAEAANLASLRELSIGANDFGPNGAKLLAASPHLGGLTELRVTCEAGASRKHLKARFGAVARF